MLGSTPFKSERFAVFLTLEGSMWPNHPGRTGSRWNPEGKIPIQTCEVATFLSTDFPYFISRAPRWNLRWSVCWSWARSLRVGSDFFNSEQRHYLNSWQKTRTERIRVKWYCVGIYSPLANSVCIIAGCRRLPLYGRHTIFVKVLLLVSHLQPQVWTLGGNLGLFCSQSSLKLAF